MVLDIDATCRWCRARLCFDREACCRMQNAAVLWRWGHDCRTGKPDYRLGSREGCDQFGRVLMIPGSLRGLLMRLASKVLWVLLMYARSPVCSPKAMRSARTTANGCASSDPIGLAKSFQDAGAGEIVINSIDRDGQMKGYDLELAGQVQCRNQGAADYSGRCGISAGHGLADQRVRCCGCCGRKSVCIQGSVPGCFDKLSNLRAEGRDVPDGAVPARKLN